MSDTARARAEYVPTTDELRSQWSYACDPGPKSRTTEEWWEIRDAARAGFDRWLDAEVAAAKAEEVDWCLQACRAYGMPRDLHAGLMARLAQFRGHGPLVYAEPDSPVLITEADHAAEVAAAESRGAVAALMEAADALETVATHWSNDGEDTRAAWLRRRASRIERAP